MVKKGFYVNGISLRPKFIIYNFERSIDVSDVKKCRMIFISKKEFIQANSYKEYISLQDNNLCMTLGFEDDEKLLESMMSVSAICEIDTDWKKYIILFKKNMNKGAWVSNPSSGAREYYKNHLYTDNAQIAFMDGKKILPMAGWNVYELTNSQ